MILERVVRGRVWKNHISIGWIGNFAAVLQECEILARSNLP